MIRLPEERPLLLGLSGGTDSLFLFHMLNELGAQFAVAHVDHGWRPESADEARQLAALAEEKGVVFHGIRLAPSEMQGNLEEACRLKRLEFFKSLCHKHGYQAVILGHHADDQAETVLKRLFEGASLVKLGGIRPEVVIDGIAIYRPLLGLHKKDLRKWLDQRGFVPFEDRTNTDPRFLRARMRERLIPDLEEIFGKKIAAPLANIADEARQLEAYLDRRLSGMMKDVKKGPFGSFLDLAGADPFEMRYLAGKIAGLEGLALSHETVSNIVEHLVAGSANKHFSAGRGEVIVDRGYLFAVPCALPSPPEILIDGTGNYQTNGWCITVSEAQSQRVSGWQDVWQGKAFALVPRCRFELVKPAMNASYPGQHTLAKWWGGRKVPAFLRGVMPIVVANKQIVGEFLSGRAGHAHAEGCWSVCISLVDDDLRL